jgi:hypothetical protein
VGKHSKDKCELCGKTAKDLRSNQEFTFVSWAVNPKTNKKGMLLCPTCDAKEMNKYHGA